jgi:hypothetical protein
LTLVGVAGVALIVFALVIGPWLFTRHPPGTLTTEQELKARNDVCQWPRGLAWSARPAVWLPWHE